MAKTKAASWLAAKVAVSACLLVWLLHDADWARMGGILGSADPLRLLPVLLALAAFILVRTWRFSVILGDHARFSLPFPTLIRYYLISCFFGLFIPGGIAGDWVRMTRVNRHGGNLGFSLQSVFLERYLGLLALFALASVFLSLPSSPVRLPGEARAALWGLLVLGAAPPVLALLRAYRPLPLPTALRESLDRLTGRTLARAAILSLLLQAVCLAVYWTVALALDMRIPPAVLSPLVLASSLATLLPVSLQGLGVNQTVFVHGLAPYGFDAEAALVFSLSIFALDLAVGIVGGLFYLVEKRTD